MRPILLKGHERAITCVIFNRDGDLIFTASKDKVPTVWLSESGERMGTYVEHGGSVWHLDCSWDSRLLVSASADMQAKVWEVETGMELASFQHTGAVRSCTFDESGRRVLTMCDAFGAVELDRPPKVTIWEQDPLWGDELGTWRRAAEFHLGHPEASEVRCQLVRWMPLGKGILCAFEDGVVKIMDPLTFEQRATFKAHESKITSFVWNEPYRCFALTSSADFTAKLWDVETWECLKTYRSDRPLNACVFSPTKEHVLLGGGQDAMSVTTTSTKGARFETQFYHLVYEEEFGRVKGHFGPINALAIAPDGKSFCSGSEDGYIRLHHFDPDYLDMPDPVPDDDPNEDAEASSQ